MSSWAEGVEKWYEDFCRVAYITSARGSLPSTYSHGPMNYKGSWKIESSQCPGGKRNLYNCLGATYLASFTDFLCLWDLCSKEHLKLQKQHPTICTEVDAQCVWNENHYLILITIPWSRNSYSQPTSEKTEFWGGLHQSRAQRQVSLTPNIGLSLLNHRLMTVWVNR